MKKVEFTLNGKKQTFEVTPEKVLLDLLREDLNLTGAKQSCDRKGQCGACTVIVDSKAVRSCLKKVTELEGADVITVEGLGTPDNPHLIQEAFVLAGAIQCGYCTPGMIMATKVLLDKNPDPDTADIKKALAHNLCRCTGYVKIIHAVKLAAKFLRKEATPAKVRASLNKKKMIGVSHPRPSSMLKACGVAKFTADIKLKNALELAAVHGTERHALIKSIDFTAAKKMPGVVGIMTAEDIKGTNYIRTFAPDKQVLCDERVRTLGDPIAVVAAETRDQARAAAAAVKVTYEKLPVMMTPEESLAEGAYQIYKHGPNLCFNQPLVKGDAKKAMDKCAAVVEGEFSTQMNHQAPLEPEVCVSYLEGKGKDTQLVIIGRSNWIHGHAGQLKEAIGWDNIRYIEPYVGGHFGIKLNVSSEAYTAAAALHFKQPVRYVPSLEESMLITTKRHGCRTKLKLGADANGRITACISEFTFDKGACFATPPIPTRALLMLSGAYHIPNIQAVAMMAYTNNASGGAARGAGPPQAIFPMETAVDLLAEKMGMDPLEFRKINSLKPGQTMAIGAPVELWPFPELCDAMKPYYERAKKEAAAFKKGKVKRGVGIACHSFGIGDPGDESRAAVEINSDDSVTVYTGLADPGEGNDSMMTQLAAEVLGLPLEKIRLYTRDTYKTPDAGPAGGSRLTFMGGGALVKACQEMAQAMKEAGGKTSKALKQTGKPLHYEGVKKMPGSGALDPVTGAGDNFHSHVHNIQMAEVEVDTETGEVKVLKMTSAIDAGPIINPHAFEGQNEGGMDQGVGWALREEYIHGKTKDWKTFKFPTIETSFEVESIFRETPRANGTLGATGIGEMTMTSTAPAVINAIRDACGVCIHNLPATPDKVKKGLAALKKT